jgi:hypothetical protein
MPDSGDGERTSTVYMPGVPAIAAREKYGRKKLRPSWSFVPSGPVRVADMASFVTGSMVTCKWSPAAAEIW